MKKLLFLLPIIVILLGVTACNTKPSHTHAMVSHEAIEASCTKEGLKEHWYCEECETYFLDSEGSNPVEYDDLIIPKVEHKDTNGDHICDYGCGELVLKTDKLQQIIESTLSSTKVTIKEEDIVLDTQTTYYFDANLLYLSNSKNVEKYYQTKDGTTYLFNKLDKWTKESTSEKINYNISYIFKDNLDVKSELSIYDCVYGIFEGETMFQYVNSLGTNVMVKLNGDNTLLEGVYICDEFGNIVYMFEMIYGENNEIISLVKTVSSSS